MENKKAVIFSADHVFLKGIEEMGIRKVLIDLCGLDPVEEEGLIQSIILDNRSLLPTGKIVGD